MSFCKSALSCCRCCSCLCTARILTIYVVLAGVLLQGVVAPELIKKEELQKNFDRTQICTELVVIPHHHHCPNKPKDTEVSVQPCSTRSFSYCTTRWAPCPSFEPKPELLLSYWPAILLLKFGAF